MHRLAIAALPLALLGTAPAPEAVKLDISLSGLRSANGEVRLCVWHGAAKFPDGKCGGESIVVPAAAPSVSVEVPLLPGDYAVSLIHDENGNGKLDTNFLGIPKEGVGFSKNPKISFGPPSYVSAKFDVAADTSEAIRMKYFL